MTAKSTTAFFAQLQLLENALSSSIKEMREAAERENPAILRRPIKLGWLDEIEELQGSVMTQMEFSRSAARLDILVSSAESCADTLEAAITRAEDLASVRYGYVRGEANNGSTKPDISSTQKPIPRSVPYVTNLEPVASFASTNVSTIQNSPLKPVNVNTPKRLAKTPKVMRARVADEPPTPRLEDLGLSSLAMNRIRRHG